MSAVNRDISQITVRALDELAVCRETLEQIEALLWALKIQAVGHSIGLAALGVDVANNVSNHIGQSITKLSAELDAAGGTV